MIPVQIPNNLSRKEYTITAGRHSIQLGQQTKVMGILNLTPDSFSQDGCLVDQTKNIDYAIQRAEQFAHEGVDIFDIGGESSRPGAETISSEEEAQRIIPTIQYLAKNFDIPISVDTYKVDVAQKALDAGASIVNNIKGTQADLDFLKIVQRYNATLVLMHMRGTPKNMQDHIEYDEIIAEIVAELKKSIEICLEIGIKSDKIIIDPGIGFGKTVEHNLEIIHRLHEFQQLDHPALIGTSRKSFIGKVLDNEVDQRLIGTMATVSASILNGAHIIRVHDVKESKETARVIDAILNKTY